MFIFRSKISMMQRWTLTRSNWQGQWISFPSPSTGVSSAASYSSYITSFSLQCITYIHRISWDGFSVVLDSICSNCQLIFLTCREFYPVLILSCGPSKVFWKSNILMGFLYILIHLDLCIEARWISSPSLTIMPILSTIHAHTL